MTDPTKSPTTAPMNAAASTIATGAPNLYQLQGGTVHVTYSTTSIDGKPRLTYQDANQTLSFTGDEIRTVQTEVGTLVTVTIRRTIDTGSTSFSILLPGVNLDSGHSTSLHTFGVTTVHRFSVIPAFNRGQTELYNTLPLSGTAQLVSF